MKDRMAEEFSPTAACCRPCRALRQTRVAEQMEWSSGKVIRIENGDVSIAPNDPRSLLTGLRLDGQLSTADFSVQQRLLRPYRPEQTAPVIYREAGLTDEVAGDIAKARRRPRRSDKIWHAADEEGDTIAIIRQPMVLGCDRTDGRSRNARSNRNSPDGVFGKFSAERRQQ